MLDTFQLSAIGGYSQTDKGEASIFLFAVLIAPIGGPPFFFITGIAGGFGYNRKLPPPGPVASNPFMQLMNGGLQLSGDDAVQFKALSSEFMVMASDYWVAAGVKFTTFGFIQARSSSPSSSARTSRSRSWARPPSASNPWCTSRSTSRPSGIRTG